MKYMTLAERFTIPRYDDPNKIKHAFVNVDPDCCTGCELCIKACPANALILVDNESIYGEGEECMGCADCVAICPEMAIVLAWPSEYSGKFKNIGFGKLALPRI